MTHIEALATLLCLAGWSGHANTLYGWWLQLINRSNLSPAEHRVLNRIRALEDAGIDMTTLVSLPG